MYPVTQQYYLRARFYNPVIGRFTQEDTYYGDGLNLYQYCQANPVGYVDPSGHNICPTQLSLYKKYKEFFAKKMPEAEAKKKAYEYMRKKMGLTADNPFTEASEGGTKSAYNDRGNTVKNWKGQNAAGAYQSATEKGNSKSGTYSVGDATFMDADDAFARNISNRIDVDANGYFDVIAHGTTNGIQITHNGQHMIVDHRTAARLIQNSDGYNGQAIRLLSCNTGALNNGFAQNLANKLNVEVYAPTNYLWSTPNGNYFVAGINNLNLPDMNNRGIFKLFSPGGN